MDVIVAIIVVAVIGLSAFGAVMMLGDVIRLGVRLLTGAGCGERHAGSVDAAHAARVLAHFDDMRNAAIDGKWKRFQCLDDELKALDFVAWAKFNADLEMAKRDPENLRHDAG